MDFSKTRKLPQKVGLFLASRHFLWVIVCLGVVLRLVQYLSNPTLPSDEAALVLNIADRSFSGLLAPLDFNMVAPAGFLFAVKVLVLTFGDSEYALRLFPFLCGLLSLLLFRAMVSRWVRPKAATIALGLFAISPCLIRYASEVKQYPCDVTVALGLYLL